MKFNIRIYLPMNIFGEGEILFVCLSFCLFVCFSLFSVLFFMKTPKLTFFSKIFIDRYAGVL